MENVLSTSVSQQVLRDVENHCFCQLAQTKEKRIEMRYI